jgi:hypothetical protein
MAMKSGFNTKALKPGFQKEFQPANAQIAQVD